MLDTLPNELVAQVLSKLDVHDVLSCRLVSTQMRDVVFWHAGTLLRTHLPRVTTAAHVDMVTSMGILQVSASMGDLKLLREGALAGKLIGLRLTFPLPDADDHHTFEEAIEILEKMTRLRELHLKGHTTASVKEFCWRHLPRLCEDAFRLVRLSIMNTTAMRDVASEEILSSCHRLTILSWPAIYAPEGRAPDMLTQLGWLERLDLSCSTLTTLPDDIGNALPRLKHLDVSVCQLTTLPESITRLGQLTCLAVQYNSDIQALPANIGALASLECLNITRCRLTSLPGTLTQLTRLTKLEAEYNHLAALPVGLGNLSKLVKLRVARNELRTLPDNIGSLTALTELDLRENNLTALPPNISGATALACLNLESNHISALPPTFSLLSNLTALDLRSNILNSLPTDLGRLHQLKVLKLSRNELTGLPASLGRLTELQKLDLRHNRLEGCATCSSLWEHGTYSDCGQESCELFELLRQLRSVRSLKFQWQGIV